MSDIAGPPVPKPISAVTHGTDRAAKSSRDPNQTPRQTTDDSGENRSKSEQRDTQQVRDPAVSISATAAHLHIGEELKERVRDFDTEGRPIIVTETATFALRPDAGLKPGDDVILQVTETGKNVVADLLRKNSLVIDPPLRLSLIVIAVHSIPAQGGEPTEAAQDKLDVAYRPTIRPANTSTVQQQAPTSAADTELLAQVLARSNTSASVLQSTSEVADNPDPLVKSNSSDLATLIAAQQSTAAGTTASPAAQPLQPTVKVPTPQTSIQPALQPGSVIQAPAASTTTHVIPTAPLTDLTTAMANTSQPTAQPASPAQATQSQPAAVGLGPIINAVTLNGIATQIQLLDPSISQVPPSEVAEVTSVQPLPAATARSLPIAAQSLGNEALARLETTKGTFVLPQQAANSLNGELIRFGPPNTTEQTAQITQTATTNQAVQTAGPAPSLQASQAQQTAATTLQQAAPQAAAEPVLQAESHSARLTSPGTQGGRQVQVQFLQQNQAPAAAASTGQSHILTTVDAVHTTRAFLTGDGPKSDLRIDTTFGTLTLTLANNVRPAVGDAIAILPNASGAAAAIPVTGTEASTAIMNTSGWPSFEQAYALVQSGMPAAAGALDARSAQGGTKLLSSMMFLMAAMKGGSPSGWLGKSAEQALGARDGGLLKLLKDELGRMFNAGAETTTSEWRSLLLPFDTKAPDMPMLAALFAQPQAVDPDAESEAGQQLDEDDPAQRFIIEVQFSVLGAIQLDGRVRRDSFDLTLWSKDALPGSLTADTNQIFTDALAANGFKGSMRFKQSDTFPVDVASVLKKQLAA